MKKQYIWFVVGLGYSLQIVASLSITELIAFIAAPFLLFRELPHLRRTGTTPLLLMSFLVLFGCIIGIIYNHTPMVFALRGLAVTALLPCVVILAHWLFRTDIGGFGWYLLGMAISNILCTFVFQHSMELDSLTAGGASGMSAAKDIMSGPIYWVTRMAPFFLLIPRAFYLKCPLVVSAMLPLGLSAFSLLVSSSGRSVALCSMATALIVLLGGKTRSTIKRRLCNRFLILIVAGVLAVLTFHFIYRVAAMSGALGERAQAKYEHQSKGSNSIWTLIMSGRMDSFGGLIACVDKPIIGFGPWAIDNYGYTEEFLSKYADYEDYKRYVDEQRYYAKLGVYTPKLIFGHSHIVGFWLWYGIFGLIYWFYVMYILIRFLKQDCYAVPQLFMWLAGSIPTLFWSIVFSPYSDRIGVTMFVVACLMVRAVRKNKIRLPQSMQVEILNYEFKHKK